MKCTEVHNLAETTVLLTVFLSHRFDDLLNEEEFLLLPPDDPRVAPVRNVCNRLVQALNDDGPLSCVSLTRENFVNNAREQRRRKVEPSARTTLAVMPFLPEVSIVQHRERQGSLHFTSQTSNPEKMMPSSSWNIFCSELAECVAVRSPL